MPSLPARVNEELGPAMNALRPQQRLFVQMLFKPGITMKEAARLAGYGPSETAWEVQAWRLTHNPRVKAAILEEAHRYIGEASPKILQAMVKIALSPEHKDQAKVGLAILSRMGLSEVTKTEHKVDITVTHEEKMSKIAEFAEELGLDKQKVLGNVVDVDYTDVADEIDPEIPL